MTTPTSEPGDELEPSFGIPIAPLEIAEHRTGQFGITGSPDVSGYGGLSSNVVLPPESLRPFGGWFDEVADSLVEALGTGSGGIEKFVVENGQLTIHVKRDNLHEIAQALRDDPLLRFEMSLGVNGVHWPQESGRELHAVYHLRSYTHNRMVRVESTCPDADPHIPSLTDIYPTNDWHERETYDMFGIIFDGHPYLTRIQMPDDWPGHPQRKDYPLGGIPVEYKGATTPPPDQRRSYN